MKKGRELGGSKKDSSQTDKNVIRDERIKELEEKATREGWLHSKQYWELWDAIYFEDFYRKLERKKRKGE